MQIKNPIFHFVHVLNRAFGDIICIKSTVSSFGMQSILRSSLRRITCCSSTLNHGGGGMSSSSSIKFRSSFPAAAAMGDAIQSVAPAFTSSQTCSFSTAPDLNGNNMIDHHDAQSPPENQKWAMYHNKIPILVDGEPPTSDEAESGGAIPVVNEPPRTSVLMELTDEVGILHDVLKYFWKYDINVSRIESRPATPNERGQRRFDFFVDFEGGVGEANVDALLAVLRQKSEKFLILDEKEVQWFPRHISELDLIANRTLDAGTDLTSDHPGFNDKVYRARRENLARLAKEHTYDRPISIIDYTKEEVETWTAVWDKMEGLWDSYACAEFKKSMELMKQHCGYSRENIPQQRDISNFLKETTGFQMRPVAGLLSSRDFLNGLAFRVFFSTQYIRHHSKPLYTPEPDICHELLGHAPMFADRDFASFSQEIGLASLGASDEDIERLARCYWFSVEFGLCREGGKSKAYGAGLLSSFGELEYACSDDHPGGEGGKPPEIKEWDPTVAANQDFPITTFQPIYFEAVSLQDAKAKMRRFCENLPRPFFAQHNAQTDTVHIDRPVRRAVGCPEA